MIEYKDIELANKKIELMKITSKTKDKYGNWIEITNDYAPVKERITAFRRVFPFGTIDTKVKFVDKYVVCVTEIYLDGKLLANGHAMESIEKRYALENCESSSVGRALGMLGFGISTSISSAEDMDSYNKEQLFDEPPIQKQKEDLAIEFNKLFSPKEKADILNSFRVKYPEDLQADLLKQIIDNKKYGQKQNTKE